MLGNNRDLRAMLENEVNGAGESYAILTGANDSFGKPGLLSRAIDHVRPRGTWSYW
jgi:hypothetical protein